MTMPKLAHRSVDVSTSTSVARAIEEELRARGPNASIAELVAHLAARGIDVTREDIATARQSLFGKPDAASDALPEVSAAIVAQHQSAKKKAAGAGRSAATIRKKRAAAARSSATISSEEHRNTI